MPILLPSEIVYLLLTMVFSFIGGMYFGSLLSSQSGINELVWTRLECHWNEIKDIKDESYFNSEEIRKIKGDLINRNYEEST